MPIAKEDYFNKILMEARIGSFWRDTFAELVATFLLVTALLFLLQDWQATPNPQAWAIQVALGMAFFIGAVGYSLGDYGGAHMNPAVTMTMLLRAEITVFRALVYWLVQIVGSVAGAFFIYYATPAAKRGGLGNTTLSSGVEWWQGLLIEFWITMVLCLTALASLSIHRKGYIILASLPIGFALGLGLFIGLPSTGGSMNPARSIGPAIAASVVMDDNSYWKNHWIYWAGPMLGAVVAAVLVWIFDGVDRVDQMDAHLYPTKERARPRQPDQHVQHVQAF